MNSWSYARLLGLLALALIWVTPALTVEPLAAAQKKRQLAWWESARPAQPTPAAQLVYAHSLRDAGRLIAASKQYRAITYAWPHSPEASLAQYNYAQLLERRGKELEAFAEYQYLLETYAGFVSYEEIIERQYGIADRYATRPRRFLGFRYQTPEEAIPLFETLIQNAPHGKYAAELLFRMARIYEQNKQIELAMETYALFQQQYPGHALRESAAFSHGKCAYQYSLANPQAVDIRQHAEAVLAGFLERYPFSAMAAQARLWLQELQMAQASILYQQALGYDRQARRTASPAEARALLHAAQLCYQRVIYEYPLAHWAETARARLSRVEQRLEHYHDH
ncbi:MAG: hypothetical protein GX806_03010 [Lentisphaerae bacterium]|nr:hypothetical protein [Lentisphaerota bacterium]